MYRPDNYSVHSDLFMSSVDESGVSMNPLFGAWRDPTRCMNSRLHVCCGKFLEGEKKIVMKRNHLEQHAESLL